MFAGKFFPRTHRSSAGKFWISAPLNGLAPHSVFDGLRQLASPLRGSARCRSPAPRLRLGVRYQAQQIELLIEN